MPRIDLDALEDEWDDEPTAVPRVQNLSVAARARIERLDVARVIGVDRGRISLIVEGRQDTVVEAVLAGTMRRGKAVVGDRVRVRVPSKASEVARVVEVLERQTSLVRTGDDALDDARVVVANVDQIVVVVAADHLSAGTGLVDRIMVAASAGGLFSALCINKVDLVSDRSEVDDVVARYRTLGIEVVVTSAVTGEGLEALGELVRGRWSAFTGHSGVGKSSLFNLLVPGADHAVADIGPRGGRHTTVASRAVPVATLDAWLVDTPGIRSFGLGLVDPRDLARHFPEFAGLSCDLTDCVHDGEPGCALSVDSVHPDRLMSYRRLLAALRHKP